MIKILIFILVVWIVATVVVVVYCFMAAKRNSKHGSDRILLMLSEYDGGDPISPVKHHSLTHADLVQMETEHRNKEAEKQ